MRGGARAACANWRTVNYARAIAGAVLVDQFDIQSLLNLAPTTGGTWKGRILGTVLTAPGNSPLNTADGTNFRGRMAMQCAVTGSRNVISAVLSPALSAAGSRPLLWAVMRLRAISVANNTHLEFTDEPVTRAQPVLYCAGSALASQDGATNALTAAYADTGVHAYGTGYSAAGAIQTLVDDTVLNTAGTGLSLQNSGASRLSVGGAFNGTSPSDSTFATLLVLSAALSAAQSAALLRCDKARWGF